mmetsp:Transcript_23052/g.23999  ORF Transcript_23052/g.23999 Transcript_23052/m.23999 type:complete len:167 (+) Transcript_23052:25-525(+)
MSRCLSLLGFLMLFTVCLIEILFFDSASPQISYHYYKGHAECPELFKLLTPLMLTIATFPLMFNFFIYRKMADILTIIVNLPFPYIFATKLIPNITEMVAKAPGHYSIPKHSSINLYYHSALAGMFGLSTLLQYIELTAYDRRSLCEEKSSSSCSTGEVWKTVSDN